MPVAPPRPETAGTPRLPPFVPGLFGVAWTLGVSALLARLGLAWLTTGRIGRRAVRVDAGPLLDTFERLADAADVRARLALSSEIEAPAVLGVRAPLVLLPVDLPEYMPAESLAPVLAHELAHVARRDYAAHLGLSVVEAWLFHCPGVWWVGRRIRDAREFSCDDAAVAVAGTRARYVEALTMVARLGALDTRPAVGMAGPRLITRARRLLEGEAAMSMPVARGAVVAALSLIVLAVVPSAFTSASRHVSARLLAATQVETAVPRGFPQRQEGSALRIVRVESSDTQVCGRFTLQNLASVAVARVRFVGVLSFAPGANRPVQIVESDWTAQSIPAGATAMLDVPLVDVSDARRLAEGGHVQAFCAVREVVYENGVVWGITPNPAATQGHEALAMGRWPALPRALVGQTRAAARPRVTLCLDEQAKEYSPGAQVDIRDEPGKAARCSPDGQWVEVDRRSGEFLDTSAAPRVVTFEVSLDGRAAAVLVKAAAGALATVHVDGGRAWGFVPSLTADGTVQVALHDMSTTPHRHLATRTLRPGVSTRVEDAAGAMSITLAPR